MSLYVISDTHFGHKNILKPEYCNRPFKDTDHMDEILIQNWNSRIKHDDIVYHLGDFGMGIKDRWQGIYNRLNGYKVLIFGNHDPQRCKDLFDEVHEEYYLDYAGEIIWMSHIPPKETYKDHVEGREEKYSRPECKKPNVTKILHGHCHSRPENRRRAINIFDVGIDGNEYLPYTIDEVLKLMALPLLTGAS